MNFLKSQDYTEKSRFLFLLDNPQKIFFNCLKISTYCYAVKKNIVMEFAILVPLNRRCFPSSEL